MLIIFIHITQELIMKSVNLTIAIMLLAITASSAQADTGSPSILSSVSPNSVETLSNAEASKMRGEYRVCHSLAPTVCIEYHTPIHLPKLFRQFGFNREHLRSYRIGWGWFRTKIYVAR